MNKRIIISEDERNRILQKHNRVLEQDRLSAGLENPYKQSNPLSNSTLTPGKEFVPKNPNQNYWQNPIKPVVPQVPQSKGVEQYLDNPFDKGNALTNSTLTPGNKFNSETQTIQQVQTPTQSVEKPVDAPITKPPVTQKKVVSKGGGQQPQQQQPAKIDNYQVYGIQDILNKKFNLGLSPDGKWGPKTAQAVLDKLAPAQPPQTP